MRFMFKTDYEDDIRLFPHSGYLVSYSVLLVVLLLKPEGLFGVHMRKKV